MMLVLFESGVMYVVYSSTRWRLDQPTIGSGWGFPLVIGKVSGVDESVGARLFIALVPGGASLLP